MSNVVEIFYTHVILPDMANSELDKLLADAAEKIRREAYAAGWRDAIAAINKAASELTDPSTVQDLGVADFTPAAVAAAGVTMGSTPWYVLQAVRKTPGMTGSEVVANVWDGGHKVSEGSIRTSLIRLEKKKLIVGRHRKWFPA